MSKKHKKERKQAAAVVPAADARVAANRISVFALAASGAPPSPAATPWTIPKPPPGVVPAGQTMAMDSDFSDLYSFASSGYGPINGYGVGERFIGYAALSELAQIPEYRRLVGVAAQELTRRWCKLTSTGDENKSDKIQQLEAAMKKFRVQDVFREAAEADGFFGIGHIYLNTGAGNDPEELKTPLIVRKAKIGRGGLKGIKVIDPLWVFPARYDSIDPLSPDFYRPESWWIMAKEIHHTRLISMVSRAVPDILKPAYQFGGVSLTQLARATVENWQRTRKSVSDLLHSFTVWQLKTNMMATLSGGEDDLATRAQMFNQFRDNRGLMVTDKETEDLANISVPLGGLDALQAQSQQHMAAISGIPLTKLLGTPPQGLNASSDGEMRSFYDTIAAQQAHLFNVPLKRVMDLIQLSEFGEIDDDLAFEWISLEEQNEAELAAIRKTDVDSDVELINAGVLHPEEVRQRLAATEGSAYHGLDVSDVPEPPENEEDPSLLPDPAKAAAGSITEGET